MMMYDVITVGSATIDVFAKTEAELVTIRNAEEVDKLIAYPCGTKILITDLDYHSGGGGTNTAVAFARLGLKTAFLGKLGNDTNAHLVKTELEKEGIEFIGKQGKGQTGFSVVLDSVKNDRTILTFKGENSNLRFSDIDKKALSARWMYFSSMIEKSYKTLEKLSAYAVKHNIKVAFNPSSYLAKRGTGFLKKLFKNVHLVILNREEAQYLVGHNPKIELLRNLRILGPKIAVITDGESGAYAYDGEIFYTIMPNRVRVMETTGAGDAFASGFLTGLILEDDLELGLDLGMANASSVIRHLGAKNNLLSLEKAKKAMKKNKRIIKKRIK